MSRIRIIQFSPFLPPHRGGLETVASELAFAWRDWDYWDFVQVTSSIGQDDIMSFKNPIIHKNQTIWYKKDAITYLHIPSVEIISNFPIYNFFHSRTWTIFSYLRESLKSSETNFVITHTRFFLTSFFGWLFAKRNNIPFIHIEHGSGHAILSNKMYTLLGVCYDMTLWKWTCKKAYCVCAVSEACKDFVRKKMVSRDVEILYRWMSLCREVQNKWNEIQLIYIWRLVSLKWVDILIEAYKNFNNFPVLKIIWDGPLLEELQLQAQGQNIEFLGSMDGWDVIEILSTQKCVVINPSLQEWLPTTVLEWLLTKNVVVASDVWGTSEISSESDLLLVEAQNVEALWTKIWEALANYDDLSGKSYESLKTKFSWERAVSKLYHIMNSWKKY